MVKSPYDYYTRYTNKLADKIREIAHDKNASYMSSQIQICQFLYKYHDKKFKKKKESKRD